MSKYYKPVEFHELVKEPEFVHEKTDDSFPGDFQIYLMQFNKLFQGIQEGCSQITRGAVVLTRSPTLKALERMAKDPTAVNLGVLLLAAEQDINRRAKQEMLKILFENKAVKTFIETKLPGVML